MTNIDPIDNAGSSQGPDAGRDVPNLPPLPRIAVAPAVGFANPAPNGASDAASGPRRIEAQQGARAPSGRDAKRDERSPQIPSFPGRQVTSSRDESMASSAAATDHDAKSDADAQGSSDALKCLVECVEQIVKELPRGAAANWTGVQAQIKKARAAFDSSCCSATSDRGAKDLASAKPKVSAASAKSDEIDRNNAAEQSANSFGR